MKTIPYPKPGEKITADLIRNILDLIREITPVAGPNIRTTRTNHGTHISAIAPQFASSKPSNDLGCFRIVTKKRSEETQEGTVIKEYKSIDNRYYSVGELVRHMEEDVDIDLDDFINQGEKPDGQEYSDEDKPFLCLVVPANPDDTAIDSQKPRLEGFHDFEEMSEAQKDTSVVVYPLYKLTHDGSAAIDFRTMPRLQVVEVI